MNEKEAIEKATAEGFLRLYNEATGNDYDIIEHSDAPDILCRNGRDEALNLEITMTEDTPMDIAALLGRSDHRDFDPLKKNTGAVRSSRATPQFSSLSENVSAMLRSRILAKLKKDYGQNVALVIRDTSPLDWAWDGELDDIRAAIAQYDNAYDRGIWILSYRKDKLYRVV